MRILPGCPRVPRARPAEPSVPSMHPHTKIVSKWYRSVCKSSKVVKAAEACLVCVISTPTSCLRVSNSTGSSVLLFYMRKWLSAEKIIPRSHACPSVSSVETARSRKAAMPGRVKTSTHCFWHILFELKGGAFNSTYTFFFRHILLELKGIFQYTFPFGTYY